MDIDNIHTIKIKIKYIILFLFGIILIILFYFNKKFEKYTYTNPNQMLIFQEVINSYLDISNNKTFNTLKTTNLNTHIFNGIIVIWSGSVDNIPSGWVLCDGHTYDGVTTPDLRSRFIIGASPSSVTSLPTNLTPKRISDISGTEEELLVDNQIPFHNHFLDWTPYGCNGSNCGAVSNSAVGISFNTGNDLEYTKYLNSQALPTNTFTNIDNSIKHNNMPPYYALAYIMKI